VALAANRERHSFVWATTPAEAALPASVDLPSHVQSTSVIIL